MEEVQHHICQNETPLLFTSSKGRLLKYDRFVSSLAAIFSLKMRRNTIRRKLKILINTLLVRYGVNISSPHVCSNAWNILR
jgi:hypothetical protein